MMTVNAFEKIARVNGIALHGAGQTLNAEDLRQRACLELLRQAAQQRGLLGSSDRSAEDGIISERASHAIERLLECELRVPEPSEQACRRYYGANAARFVESERVRLRHILFAVTPGVDVVALRKRAEQAMLDVRCHRDGEDFFASQAAQLSNCPSGARGGDLGWLQAQECAPEFATEVFGKVEVGVLPRLVHSRFGLHVVEVVEREAGREQSFEAVEGAVRAALRHQSYVTALRQYLNVLAGEAVVEGVDLEGSDTPLVQ